MAEISKFDPKALVKAGFDKEGRLLAVDLFVVTENGPFDQVGDGRVLVVGASASGLQIADELAQAGREVIVLEAAEGIGTVTSSRNSEVIHAGMYYPTGSLRAQFCPRGNRMLYEFCESHGVPHRRCGTTTVASSSSVVSAPAPVSGSGPVRTADPCATGS